MPLSPLFDFTDLRDNFQVGKALRLADWSFERDRRAFDKLCHLLRVKKNQREALQDERAEHVRELRRARQRKPENRAKAYAAAKRRRRAQRATRRTTA
jgi:hypothetical protein